MIHMGDHWLWISVASGIALSFSEGLIVRWADAIKKALRCSYDVGQPMYRFLNVVIGLAARALVIGLVLSYALVLRRFVSIPTPVAYALPYLAANLITLALASFLLLRRHVS